MDNDLISRSELLEKSFLTEPATMINPYGGENVVRVEDIENAPAVDAVVPVRCKDCKHYGKNLENDTYCSSVNGLTDPEEDDFCSYGERKEG